MLLYLKTKNLHAFVASRVTWRWQICTIHQPLSQPVNSYLNVASKAVSR